jgi:formate hydrogenlyase transcriptional activator
MLARLRSKDGCLRVSVSLRLTDMKDHMAPLEIKPNAKIDTPIRFEMVLAEISTLFINLPADRIDSEIENAQRDICKHLDMDRSTLWQFCEGEPDKLLLTHIYRPPESPPPPEQMNAKDFFPWSVQKIMDGETLTISKMPDLPPEAELDLENYRFYGTRSNVIVPLSVGGGTVFGLLGVSLDISERKRMEDELIERLKEIEKLKLQLENENLYLRKELKREKGFDKIVGDSKAIRSVIFSAGQVAPTDATVLILGETGTGKGMVANAIHQMSARKDRPLVTVNCTVLPRNLIESELFGCEKGAFTGAHARQAGRFEVADGGTIFLDEIGEMPLELQSKLLRVLQEGEFERLGSARTVKVNVRVIAATSRDLKKDVRERCFREDLFYRLNVFPISIPPLRERTEDIPLLAQYFTEKYARKMNKQIESIPKSTIKTFMEHDWPGNVRELEHVIERGVIMTSGRSFRLACRLISSLPVDSKDEPLKDLTTLEREHILRVLQEAGWRIEGPSGAASILKLNPSTLRFRINKLGIRRPA